MDNPLKHLRRYNSRVPPTIEVSVTVTDAKGEMYGAGCDLSNHVVHEITGSEPPYGWSRQRRNVTESIVRKAIARVMAYESVQALDEPRVHSVRVTSSSLLWWTYPESD